MFNVGAGEVFLIALLALIVLGPERLPEAARKAGAMLTELRRLSAGLQQEVRAATDFLEVSDRAPGAPGTPTGPYLVGPVEPTSPVEDRRADPPAADRGPGEKVEGDDSSSAA